MTTHRPIRLGATVLLLASGAVLAVAQSPARLPADLDPDSRARLPYLQRKDMDERSQKIFDTLPGRSSEGILRGPLAFAAYNPGVAQALFALHNAAVGEGNSILMCANSPSWSPAARRITAWSGMRTRRVR
jgi:hypothetical protein